MVHYLCVLVFILVFQSIPALGQDDVTQLRQQLQAQKQQLEEQKKIIESLEKRLDSLESLKENSKTAMSAPQVTAAESAAPQPSRPIFGNLADRTSVLNARFSDARIKSVGQLPFSQYRFVPDIALIVDMSLLGRNMGDSVYNSLAIPGFLHGHGHDDHGHSHAGMNADKGFNLNYGELSMSSTVDPYFDLFATFHLTEESFEIEEAYASTRALPFGFQVKAGKFLSGFGRLNSQHPHMWDFGDQPLVYKVFYGDEGLLEKGAQMTWLAPTKTYLLFGLESLQGQNAQSFGTKGFSYVQNGTSYSVSDTNLPNVWTGFVKSSVDVGDLTLLGGLSFAYGGSRTDSLGDEHEPHAFAGISRIYGADITAKYMLDSYRYLSLQAEYMYRKTSGTKYVLQQDNPPTTLTSPLKKDQSGVYAQLVYRFAQQWRAGFRYDLLARNDVSADGIRLDLPDNLPRYSFMVDFSPSEFSRLRLQFNHDRSRYAELNRKTVNEVFLQLNVAIGAHGAHAF